MSHQAIAAALARQDLSCGERLVALALASFADRENRARPGTPAAAGRAGRGRSGFLAAREQLVGHGLVVVEEEASGRGRASTLWLAFADAGPWWEGEINAELFEAVLGYSRTQGPARLLLAAMAALADEERVVQGVTTARLCEIAGMTDRTYRRARASLLGSGELVLRSGTGGRGNANCWEIPAPQGQVSADQPSARRRVPPPPGVRPLVTTVAPSGAVEERTETRVPAEVVRAAEAHLVRGGKGGQDRTLSAQNCPVLTGVFDVKGGQDSTVSAQDRPDVTGVSPRKGGQDRTLSLETPAKTPAKTPAPNARAGREPQNPRTVKPPNPPEGGSGAGQVEIEETYVTGRGRRRSRLVAVDLAAVRARLAAAGVADRVAWEDVRTLLRQTVGESTFEIWMERLELIAVDRDGSLVIDTPVDATRAWVPKRFGRTLARCAAQVGRVVRFAQERERLAVQLRGGDPPAPAPCHEPDGADAAPTAATPRRVASRASARSASASAGRSPGSSSNWPADGSGHWQLGRSSRVSPSRWSQTHVYDQEREVS